MAEPLEESLSFDISDALSGIQSISDALDQVVAGFATGLAAALETLTAVGADVTPLADTLDVAGLGTAIDTALAQVDTPIQVEGDASGLEQSISDAIDAPQPPVDVTGDASQVTDAIDQATAVEPTIDVTADTSAAQQAIDGLDNEPVTLDVDADTSAAQDQIDNLSQSVSGLGKSSSSGGEQIAGLEGAVLGLRAATGGAQGEVGGLSEGIGSIGGSTAVAVGGLAVLGGFIGETTKLAADAQAQNKRFADTFGNLAEQVQQIHVGGLNTDLKTLGETSGTTTADLEATASRIGLLGQSSGASNSTIVSTTQNLLALGATLSVNNPRLGDAASVTDRLTNAFARGGRALAPFGIALSSAQINAEALDETGKTTAADLTLFEKSTAGANLALQTFGDTLGTKFQNGAQNAQVQLRALKVQLEETLVAIGKPLLQPLVTSLTDLLPVAEQVGIVLGRLAEDVLPLLAAAAPILTPLADAIGLIGDGLQVLGPAGIAVAAGLAILVPDLVLVSAGFSSATVTATAFGAALDFATGPVGIVLGALAALGAITHVFGSSAKEATTDTSGLATAFASATGTATTFHDILGQATDDIDAFLRKQLAIKTAGVSGVDIANLFGFSFSDLDKALQGTSDGFDHLLDSGRADRDLTKSEIEAKKQFTATLVDSRDTLEANARATIASSVASGLLSQAQADAAIRQTKASDGTRDYVTALRELTPALDAASAAINANATAQSVQSPAFADLIHQFAAGKLTIDTLTSSLAQFGFVGQGAADEAKKISDAITSIVSTSTSALPTASSAISDYSSTVQKDFQAASQAATDHKNTVHDLFGQLVADSDPAKFTANLIAQAKAITDFEKNLEIVARSAPELAIQIGQAGPAAGAQLAAGFASDANKAKAAESGLALADAASAHFESGVNNRAAAFEAGGGVAGHGFTTGALAALNSDTSIGDATAALGAKVSGRFHPDFSHAVTAQIAAAQQALAADPSIGQAAGNKALEVVAAFTGPLSLSGAANLALKTAHDALAGDTTLAAAAGQKGTDTAAAFKPDVAGSAAAAFAQAAALIPGLQNVPNVAGLLGVEAGEAFGQGLANGIDEKSSVISSAASAAASGAAVAARKALGIASPSKVGHLIGTQFVDGLTLGLVDATPETATAAAQVASNLITKLQAELAAGIAKINAQTAVSALASSATSQLPTVGADIANFMNGITQAQQAEGQALDIYHKAYGQYRQDQGALHQLQASDSSFQIRFSQAQRAVASAQANLVTAQASGNAARIATAQNELSSAEARLASLQERIDTLTGKIAGDQKAISDAAAGLSAAQKAVAAASNPDQFISNLNKSTQASQRFLHDIQILQKEGFTQLAQELLDAGPDVAGKLADSFAGSTGKAKQANAAIIAADTFGKTFTDQINKLFGSPALKATATTAGQTIGLGVNAGLSQVIKFDPSATNKLTVPSLSAPLQKVAVPVTGVGAVTSIDLNLNVTLPDGTLKNAQVTIPVRVVGQTLKQQTVAEVKAS